MTESSPTTPGPFFIPNLNIALQKKLIRGYYFPFHLLLEHLSLAIYPGIHCLVLELLLAGGIGEFNLNYSSPGPIKIFLLCFGISSPPRL